VKLVDANVLLYATDERSPRHAAAAAWLVEQLNGSDAFAFTWSVLLAFLRLSTSPRVFAHPLSAEQALDVIDGWLGRPCTVLLEPGTRHQALLRQLLRPLGTAGNLASDAHLAAIAIEHGAELSSCDADFSRFPGLRWINPLP
jgi:toxin-antitoxin system PIN domain toxin